MSRPLDLKGKRFGKLVGVERAANSKNGSARWVFRCDCGNEKVISASIVKNGITCSCGCLKLKRGGLSRSREYQAWNNMIRRCHDPKNSKYLYYGGSGISVCERWRSSFQDFLADMGNRPSPAHSIDRIDRTGNYEPGNCRWTTIHIQMRNRRNNIYATIDGVTMTLAEWGRRYGKTKSMIWHRINKMGMTPEQAITSPSRYGNSRPSKEAAMDAIKFANVPETPQPPLTPSIVHQ